MILVVLPGMDGTGTLHADFVAALEPEFDVRVLRYPTQQPLDYAALECVASDALPSGTPFWILGESFSGPIAVSIAASHPVGLQGLILCCTFVRNPRPAFCLLKRYADWLPVTGAPFSVLSHLLLGRRSTRALRDSLKQALRQVAPSVLRARLLAVLTVNQ